MVNFQIGELQVTVETVECSGTYAGVLEMSTNKKNHDRLLARRPERARQRFGCDAVILFDPRLDWHESEMDEYSMERRKLPKWQVTVVLKSYWTPSPDWHGTWMTMVFFCDDIFDGTLRDLIRSYAERLDWKESAKPFCF